MKKFLMIAALALSVSVAGAQTVDLNGLTPAQINELAAKAAAMKSDPAIISATVRSEAEAWGSLGSNMGKAVVSAAREVGVAANEFSQTPLGKIVMFMAVYKIVGEELLGVIFGTLTLFVGTLLAIWVAYSKSWFTREYEVKPFLWGAWQRKVLVKLHVDSDTAVMKGVGGAILLVFTWLVGLNTIF